MSALSDLENVELVVVDEGDTPPVPEFQRGMTNSEALDFLTAAGDLTDGVPNAEGNDLDVDDGIPDGDDDSDTDVTAEHTGAMIALIPRDPGALVIDGGEPVEELHLTLWYLGDAAVFDESTRGRIVNAVGTIALEQSPLMVTGFGVAVWNPNGDDPCVVLNVGGPGLDEARESTGELLEDIWSSRIPEQHEPWQPHVCLAYTSKPAGALIHALERVGPIVFDRVRVAFGGSNTDIPLGYIGSDIVAAGETMTDVVLETSTPETSGVGGVGNTNLPGTVPTGMSVEMATLADGRVATWEGILVVEGVETGDGREFSIGSLEWAAGWLPLRWAPEDFGAHDGAVDVARIDEIWRDVANPAIIRGRGVFNVSTPEGLDAFQRVDGGFLKGVSVDVDSIKDADVELVWDVPDPQNDGDESGMDLIDMMFASPSKTIFHKGRLRGATLVSLPAFVEAQIQSTAGVPVTQTQPEAVVAAVDDHWDADAAARKLAIIKRTNAAIDAMHGPILHHHVGLGSVGAPNVTACLDGMRRMLTDTSLKMSMIERRMTYDHLAAHLHAAGMEPPTFAVDAVSDDVRALTAAAIADDGYVAPPLAYFQNPNLEQVTPITIDGDRVYGHAATWGVCHIGFQDACVTAPSNDDFRSFHLGQVVTAEGSPVSTGTITIDTGHASQYGVNARQAVAHYDDTGTAIAYVVCGNDEHGIWFSGVIRYGTPASKVAELRAAKISGDWRRVGSALHLVALLAVNVPGFAVPRLAARVNGGVQESLLAAGIVDNNTEKREAVEALKSRLRSRALKSTREGLRDRVHKGR